MKGKTRKVIRKIAAYLLLFGLCVPLLQPAAGKTAKAAEVQWWYAVKADGTAEITGVTTDATAIEIPEMINGLKVTGIGDWAFSGCSSLKSIKIPDSITSIGYKAFYCCSGLESIEIPDSVTSIGGWAFYCCSGLKSIEIPDSVTSIGDYVFYWCSGLESIVISDSITSIGECIFFGCSSLESIEIPDSVTSIGDYAFSCSGLESIVVPDSVTSIGDYAFDRCISLESIEIPDSVISIGSGVFYSCFGLESIEIPDSVISIGDYAFAWCSGLKSITIPDSVTSIGENVFSNCPKLLAIYAAPGSVAETYAASYGIIVKTDTAINPVVTPTPIPTPTPTPEMGVTFAPIVTEQSPTPTPTLPPTPTPTPTPTPELGISVTPAELSADAQGNLESNQVEMAVTSAYSCTVSTGDFSWLKVCKKNASASAGSSIWLYGDESEWSGSFYVFANENTSVVPRTGEITITAEYGDKKVTETVVVKQEAGKAVLTVSTAEITANAKGKTSVSSVKVDTNKTGGFSVSNDGSSWIKVGSSSYGDGAKSNISYEKEGTFYVFVSENPSDEARTGQITVTHEDGETKQTIEVKQEGVKASLTVDSTSKTADSSGYFYNNAISVKTSRTGAFTATVNDAEWLKVSTERNPSFADGMDSVTLDGDGYIYLVADKNSGEEQRTATITISHAGGSLSKTVTVTQLGKAASYLEVDREAAYFDEPTRAIDGAVHISASEDTKWTVTSSESWIKILKNNWSNPEEYASIEGTGAGTFYILVKENDTYEERSGYITISAPGLESHEIYVQQAENEVSLDTLLQELTIRVTKKTFKKGKTTQIKLNYPEGLYASDIKSVKFSSNKKKVATVNSKGVVKGIKKGKAVITVKVTLENGSSKTFKAKITVDKRKVKLSKFK